MKNYINGITYGIKISIKLMAKMQDIKQGINILCKVQNNLENSDYDNNIEVWQYFKNVLKYCK